MSRDSALVVLGRVTEVRTTSNRRPRKATGTIHVNRHLKGVLDAKAIHVEFAPGFPEMRPDEDDVIWFIRGKQESGRYLITDWKWGKQSLEMILRAIYWSDPRAGNPWASAGAPEVLAYRITTDKDEYILWEPIQVTCTLTNTSDRGLKLLLPEQLPKGRIDCYVSKVSYFGKGGWEWVARCGVCASPEAPRPLKLVPMRAHETWRGSAVLYDGDRRYPSGSLIDRPGRYRVRAIYRTLPHEDHEGAWHGAAPAEEVYFTVVETRVQAALRYALGRLPTILAAAVAILAGVGVIVHRRLRRKRHRSGGKGV